MKYRSWPFCLERCCFEVCARRLPLLSCPVSAEFLQLCTEKATAVDVCPRYVGFECVLEGHAFVGASRVLCSSVCAEKVTTVDVCLRYVGFECVPEGHTFVGANRVLWSSVCVPKRP